MACILRERCERRSRRSRVRRRAVDIFSLLLILHVFLIPISVRLELEEDLSKIMPAQAHPTVSVREICRHTCTNALQGGVVPMPSNLGTVLRVDLRMPLAGATVKTWRLFFEPLPAVFLPHELQSIPARVTCQLQANPSYWSGACKMHPSGKQTHSRFRVGRRLPTLPDAVRARPIRVTRRLC